MSDSRKRMTVARLREVLERFPQDAEVYAYEGEPSPREDCAAIGVDWPCSSMLVINMPDGTQRTIPTP